MAHVEVDKAIQVMMALSSLDLSGRADRKFWVQTKP